MSSNVHEALTKDDGKHATDSIPLDKLQTHDDLALDTVDAVYEYSDAYMRKLRWKIDWWLLPVMWICYGTQQADKTSLSVQAIFGIREDTGLVGEQYNWLSTIFYLSYMFCEFPANWLMQKCNTSKYLATVMFLWGVVVLCIAFAKNFTHLMILRFLQGALECTISPTFMLLTGTWYTSQEHTLRSVIWGTSNAGMNIITGLINYGIGAHAQSHPGGLAPWKGISFFLGALTIFDAVLVYFIIGTPREVRWLTEDEKRAAMARVVANQTGSDRNKHAEFKWEQVWGTFRDPQTYFFFFVTFINALPNGANTTFSKLIWKSFGFSDLDTLLKGSTPYYAISICWFLVVGYITLKKPNLRCKYLHALTMVVRDANWPSPVHDVVSAARLLRYDGTGASPHQWHALDALGHVYPAGLWNPARIDDLDLPTVKRGWANEEDCHGYRAFHRLLCR